MSASLRRGRGLVLTVSKCSDALEVFMREELISDLGIGRVIAKFPRLCLSSAMRCAARNGCEGFLSAAVVHAVLANPHARSTFFEEGGGAVRTSLPPSEIVWHSAQQGDEAAVGVDEGNGDTMVNESEVSGRNERRTFQAN